jgi:hypothetical protein
MRADFFPRCRLIWVFVLVSVLLGTDVLSGLANKAHGASEAAAQPSQAASSEGPEEDTFQQGEAEDKDIAILEESRKEVREATEWAARGVDSWFGDIPFEKGGKISKGRIRLRTIWREHDEVDVNLRFRVRMTLPNLQDKAYVIIGSENERDLVRGRPDTVKEQQRLLRENKKDDETFFAGIGLNLLDLFSFSVGLRDLYKPYLKIRYIYTWQIDARNELEFTETGFWALNDGFGATTSIDYEHTFSPVLSLRWLNSGTVSEEDDGLDWFSSLGLYRLFGELSLLSGELIANGETGSEVDVEEYGVLVKWRQPLYRNWLFGEFSTGHYWVREKLADDREGKWALGVGVQMNF